MNYDDPSLIASGEYNRFYKSLQFVLAHEGGYTNDPSDPGGETKWGISKKSHPALDIKNLTAQQCAQIYFDEYWAASKSNTQEFPNCTIVFDSAVNCGVSRALSFGGVLSATNQVDPDSYLSNRLMYYVGLVKKNPALQKFLSGWTNRINDLKKFVQLNVPPDTPLSYPTTPQIYPLTY
jgi:Glycosyl hydrolase 108